MSAASTESSLGEETPASQEDVIVEDESLLDESVEQAPAEHADGPAEKDVPMEEF